MPNLFTVALASGRVRTERDLKRLFWRSALKLHPDTAHSAQAEARFVRMKADYDRALEEWNAKAALAAAPGTGGEAAALPADPADTRRRCLRVFIDLVATNFPIAPVLRVSAGYRRRLAEFAVLFARLRPDRPGAFAAVEAELYRLRGNDIVQNPLFGAVKMIFYSVSSWHCNPTRFGRQAVGTMRDHARPYLEKAGYRNLADFIDWLVDELDNGVIWT